MVESDAKTGIRQRISAWLEAFVALIPPAWLIGIGFAIALGAAAIRFAIETDDGPQIFIADLVGSSASTIVAFGATAGIFLAIRSSQTKHRILSALEQTKRGRDEAPPAMIELLATQLTQKSPRHLVVEVDRGADRENSTSWLFRSLVARRTLAVTISTGADEGDFEAAARSSFISFAERSGERGDVLAKLWERQWRRGQIVLIVTDLDAGVVPGDRAGMSTVERRLRRLSRLPAPTIAFIAPGSVEAHVEVEVQLDLEGFAGIDDPQRPTGEAERVALARIGRFLHLRNQSQWSWSDVADPEPDRDVIAVGLASLVARGYVTSVGSDVFTFPSQRILARERGDAVGTRTDALWSQVLAMPPSPVVLDSWRAACAATAAQIPSDAVIYSTIRDQSGIGTMPANLGVLAAAVEGVRAIGSLDNVDRGADIVPWLQAAWANPDLTPFARVDAIERLGISESVALTAWAWPVFRDSSKDVARLAYPVRRALANALATNAQRSNDTLLPQWQRDAATLDLHTTMDGTRSQGWDPVATACHMAWLLPMVYAASPAPAGAELAGILDHLGALADVARARTASEATLAYLQAWTEGLYFAALRLDEASDPRIARDLRGFVERPVGAQEPWASRLALTMARGALHVSLATGPDRDANPIVAAMAVQLAEHVEPGALWANDFAELRRGAPELTDDSRWILAAKAIVFSAAEARRATKDAMSAADSRDLMLGDAPIERWLPLCRDGRATNGDAWMAALLACQDRHVSRSFARTTLAARPPRDRSPANREFWATMSRILERIADAPERLDQVS